MNYYLKRVRKIGWVPALTLKEIDISKDSFKDNIIANFRYALRYDLSADSIMYEKKKAINSFYTKHSVIHAETEDKKQLRLQLYMMTANIIRLSMVLLGIRVPERMLV